MNELPRMHAQILRNALIHNILGCYSLKAQMVFYEVRFKSLFLTNFRLHIKIICALLANHVLIMVQ